jgi:hypothetical protein
MATTAIHSGELTTRRERAAEPVHTGLLARIAAFFAPSHSIEEERVLARFAGQRWCDATERQLSGALSSDHSFNW